MDELSRLLAFLEAKKKSEGLTPEEASKLLRLRSIRKSYARDGRRRDARKRAS